MATQTPFMEMGRTTVLIANATSGTTIINSDSPPSQFRFYNANATWVYVNIGSAAGNTVAAIPVAGTPAYGVPIAPQSQLTLTGWQGQGSNVTIAVINGAAANTLSTVYVTPGEGFAG